MAALGTKMRSARGPAGDPRYATDRYLIYWCLACDKAHIVRVEGPTDGRPKWDWDGNVEEPSLGPSVMARATEGVCHHFVKAGKIIYCRDSTHSLTSQTVDLPPWPLPEWRDCGEPEGSPES